MSVIHLVTSIMAPIAAVFDAALSIDLHIQSMAHTGERVLAGPRTGVAAEGENITWEARHFGLRQHLSVVIEKVERPLYFRDSMTKGAFTRMTHHHYFEEAADGVTLMRDEFYYGVPYGLPGKLFDMIILRKYLRRLLERRNNAIRNSFDLK